MSMSLNAPLPSSGMSPAPELGPTGLPQKTAADYPTKFEEVVPGSTILVSGPAVYEPFEATVLDMVPEHGHLAIPALLISHNETGEMYSLPSNGSYVVRVLVDGRRLAAVMPAPRGARRVHTIVRKAVALRFTGGVESASEIVRWAIGSATFRYIPATDVDPEHLVQAGLGGATVNVYAGDYVVKVDDGRFQVLDAKQYAATFEEE